MADGGPGGLLDSWCPFCCSRLFLLSSSSCCYVLLLQLLRIRQCMEPLCSCSLWQWRCCGLRQGESQYFRKPTRCKFTLCTFVFVYFCIFVFAVSLCGSDGVALPKVVVSKPAALDASSPSPTIPLTLASTLQCVPTHVLKKFNRKDISEFVKKHKSAGFVNTETLSIQTDQNFVRTPKSFGQ